MRNSKVIWAFRELMVGENQLLDGLNPPRSFWVILDVFKAIA